jgi:hypothetical protein
LQGAVAVGGFGLDLGDAVVGHVKHRHGNGVAVVREDAHHAHLAAQQTEAIAQTHVFFSIESLCLTHPTSIGRAVSLI